MAGPAGATMPLAFGGSDAGYSDTQAIGSQVAFDPKQPFLATLNKNGRGSVFIGGTAPPGSAPPARAPTRTPALTPADVPPARASCPPSPGGGAGRGRSPP